MAVLKKIKFGSTTSNIQFTEVKPVSGGVITATPSHTSLEDEKNPEYAIDLTIANDGTLVKNNGALKVGTVPAAQVSVAAGGHTPDTEDDKKFLGDDVEEVLTELNDKIAEVGGKAKSYKIVSVTPSTSTNLAEYKIQEKVGSDGTWSDVSGSATIAVPKDQHLKSVELVNQRPADTEQGETDPVSGQFLKYTYVLNDGTESDVYVDVSVFLTQSEFGYGLQVSSAGVVSVKIDTASEKDSENADFLTVGADGVKIQGIKDEINRKIAALDVTTDAALNGQYVAAIQETDGIVSVKTRANVSEAVLNNYAKGTAPASLDIAATDTINQALAKLEHQVDAAEAAAQAHHSVVAKDANAGHLTLATSTNGEGATVYTIGENNIASASDLTAEVTRAKNAESAIDTAVGLTKAADPSETRTWRPTTNYGGSTTSVKDNMQAIDAQLKTVSDNLANIKYNVVGTTLILSGITQDSNLTA